MPSLPRVSAVLAAALALAATLTPPARAATTPVGAVESVVDDCSGLSPATSVAGDQTTKYRLRLSTATAVDARTARWTQVDAQPVEISGRGGVCWNGGVIEGTYPDRISWKTMKGTSALVVSDPAATIENVRIHDYGDGLRFRGGAQDWIVRAVVGSFLRDDCIEDDKLNGGVVSMSLFDGCYIGVSANPRASDTKSDGSHETVGISRSLLRLQPMPTVSIGPAPGHGGFFDWDETGRAPRLSLIDNVFRADQPPNHGTLGLPAHTAISCEGNTIVWLGTGAFPGAASWLAACPDTRIVTDPAAWDDALNAWSVAVHGSQPTTATATTTTTSAPSTTTSPTTSTSTTSTTTTTTTTAPPAPAPSTCLSRTPQRTVSGVQTSRYATTLSSPTAVDARTASWTQVDDWPISVKGTASVCWTGGRVIGTYPDSTTWDVFHSTGAFNVANPDSVVENLRVHDYGDGIRLRAGASSWTVRGVHESYLHDDCLENDKLGAGLVDDSLFDGCYVAFSARPSSSDSVSDGRTLTMTVQSSLVRLQPMPTVYKGPAPGHGGFFKWDDNAGRSPKLALYDNVFRVDQLPNHGSLGLPDGYDVACRGNVVVWLGDGAFPEAASWLAKCPDTRIVTAASVWSDAVTAWLAAH